MTPKFVIYTDGSCEPNPGPGGWAAILRYTNDNGKTFSRCISGHTTDTTNNRMEVMAVLAALKRLKYACDVVVYSDSKYVVDAVGDWVDGQPSTKRGWMVKWRKNGWVRPTKKGPPNELKNSDLWQELYYLIVRHRSITMRWIRGHAGNKFNELCDAVALEERIKATNGLLEARPQT